MAAPPLLPTEAALLLLLLLAPPCCCWTGPLLLERERPLVTPPPALPPRPRPPPRPAPRPPRPPRPRPPLFVFMISSRLMSILSAILIDAQYLKIIKLTIIQALLGHCCSLTDFLVSPRLLLCSRVQNGAGVVSSSHYVPGTRHRHPVLCSLWRQHLVSGRDW